jgi:Ca-activated chloride channel family protein
MVSFAYPYLLYLLFAIPVIIGLFLLARLARRKKLQHFGQLAILSRLMPDASQYVPAVKIAIQMIAIAALVIVLARPRAGAKEEVSNVKGIEVMVAFDVSNSMLASATDDPNGISRLQRAKHVLEKLIDKLNNDKVGLIVFAGESYTQLPITSDFVSAKMYLNDISTNMVPTQGTAIGSAINMASQSFSPNTDVQKAIIVITDGENQVGDAVETAKEVEKLGIQVDVIGLGSGKGAPIPLNKQKNTFLKDDEGHVVTTYLNEQMAQDIAKAGGGIYVNGAASSAVNDIANQLDKLAKSNLERVSYSASAEQFPVFAWIALLLIIVDACILERKIGWLRQFNFFTNGKIPKADNTTDKK